MIVGLDTQLAVGTATGIGVYQRDLLAALRAAGTDVRELSAPWLDPWRFDRRVAWDQVLLPLSAARSGATLLHASGGTLPLLRTMPVVVTVHDVAWLRVQSHTRAYARAYFGSFQARAYRGANAIVCDSHFSAAEYRELVDPRVVPEVIYPGVDPRFGALRRAPAEAPFALVVGTVEARKNLLVLVEALPAIPDLRIVSVGPATPYADAVRARAAELGVTDRVALRGYVSPEERDDLYARATCALIPSRYEGFGYALAEALCAGVPALAADASSLVEVARGAVALIGPDDVAGWTDAIRALLAGRDAAEAHAGAIRSQHAARFAWPAAAAAMRAVYERVAAQ
ncbi:MAG: hypothetical protein NVS3B7_01530 [Candidatus Elarobacter sp.]